jgi:hypothetical protein
MVAPSNRGFSPQLVIRDSTARVRLPSNGPQP